jgi:hypothetical protein
MIGRRRQGDGHASAHQTSQSQGCESWRWCQRHVHCYVRPIGQSVADRGGVIDCQDPIRSSWRRDGAKEEVTIRWRVREKEETVCTTSSFGLIIHRGETTGCVSLYPINEVAFLRDIEVLNQSSTNINRLEGSLYLVRETQGMY